jgi:TolB-like protein/Flp pilus assembly protein TadD
MMPDPSLLMRLKERKLVQWALAYLAGAFVVLQALDPISEAWGISPFLLQSLQVLLVVGFFVTLVLAWYHGEKGRQKLGGAELVLLTLLLLLAGSVLSLLPGEQEGTEPAGLSDFVRLAAVDPDRPTIAVLPLANLSTDEENAYFAAGIQEELLRLLSLVRELRVISRTSVLQYAGATKSIREIAVELRTRYILEGSVQKHGGRVRIQAQLIDATTDEHIWADRYDRSLDDVFELQTDVAEAIAGALEAAIAPDEQKRIEALPTQNPVAYDLYLRTAELSHYRREDQETAIGLLRRATELDPQFSLAHARLASFFRSAGVLDRAYPYDSALVRAGLALESGPDEPSALSVRAYTLWEYERNDQARPLLLRALELDPNSGVAWRSQAFVGWTSGDYVEGALAGRRAVKLDPNNVYSYADLGYSLLFLEMHDELELWMERALVLSPEDLWGWQVRITSALARGDVDAARAHATRMREAGADNLLVLYYSAFADVLAGDLDAAEERLAQISAREPGYSNSGNPTAEALLAWVRARQGRAEPAQIQELRHASAARLEQYPTSMVARANLAVLADALHDEDEALRWFLQWSASPRTFLGRRLPFFDAIRDRAGFQEWLDRMGERLEAQRREMAALGPWTPEEVLGRGAGAGS